jgi:hypothetical protein
MFESIHHPKKNTTMAMPNAGSSGMAIVINGKNIKTYEFLHTVVYMSGHIPDI